MLNVAICDDEPQMATDVENILAKYNPTLFTISAYYNPAKLAKDLHHLTFDFFILDIELSHQSGIELAKIIRDHDYNVPIIFLTNYSEYMEDVFQVQTFDYILKPASPTNLFPVLDKVIKYLNIDTGHFSFSSNRIVHNLKLSDIVFFEKQRRQVIIHTKSAIFTTNMTTSAILEQIDADFVQVHNSYIINTLYIEEVSSTFVILSYAGNSTEIPISRKFRSIARDQILERLKSRIWYLMWLVHCWAS